MKKSGTSAVEFDGALEFDNGRGVTLLGGLIELLEGFVVISDVSLVVFLVMQLHDLPAYDWL